MENEISPEKKPFIRPPALDEEPPKVTTSSFVSKSSQSNVPEFGYPTLPKSNLTRVAQKESSVFIQPKARPEHHRDADRPAHPHLQVIKDVARKVVDPFLPRAPAAYHPEHKYEPSPLNGVPIRAPAHENLLFKTTRPIAQPTFSSMPVTQEGFQPVNSSGKGGKYVDFFMNNYRDLMDPDEPYTFVDSVKAEEDLKALLEGAIEDEDDQPRTRSRKRRQDEEADGLLAKVKALSVGHERLAVTEDDEEEDQDDGTVDGISVKLLPHQVEGFEWMKGRELGTGKKGTVPKGGILADDMGLGKTLQSISLILNNPRPSPGDVEFSKRKLPSGLETCTLVVAPLALIRQWELEIKEKVASSHQLRVYVHHGPQRTKRFQDLIKYDVVITTYQILVSEHGNSSEDSNGIKVGCFGVHWYRVILDEAHSIKNRNAKAAKACYALQSQYRWCLTGTPMQNNLDELQSLVKFLRIKPYDDLREWKDQIDRPMKNGRGDVAIKRLRHFLIIFMKRRTKEILKGNGALNPGGKTSTSGEGSIIGFKITERKIEKVFADFSPEERRFYQRLEQRTSATIKQMISGQKVNYASALVMLLRLRQACNHPKLIADKLGKDSEALSVESGSSATRNAKPSRADIDEMADMFGAMGVGSKKCEVCQLELGKEAQSQAAFRCLDCEADLENMTGKQRSHQDTKNRKKHNVNNLNCKRVPRKPRNRAIIQDSDEEEGDGQWVVPKKERGSLRLGQAGGIEDENAEGGGEWLDSDNDDIFPDLQHLGTSKAGKKEIISINTSESSSGSTSQSEAEHDFHSSSEEEEQLTTLVTSTKITHLLRILGKEVAQHKFIVFSQFTSMLDLIEPFLRQNGYNFARYDGKMKNDHREASLNKLRNDPKCRVLLCSLKCGSLGLNLTAATRVVILEPFWNPFVEEQAIDRVHRLTQTVDVIVYKITIKDSVEERILDLQEKKRELANQTIEGGQAGTGKLGMKEILQLFRREAEHEPPDMSAAQYDLGSMSKILEQTSTNRGIKSSGKEGSVIQDRKVTPPFNRSANTGREDSIYSRRW